MAAGSFVRSGLSAPERCRWVAECIERHPEHFDMGAYEDGPASGAEEFELGACGTTACIGGWAYCTTPRDELPNPNWGFAKNADALLGLDGAGEGSPEEGFVDGLFFQFGLKPPDAAFLLRWHADVLERAS